MQAEINIGLLGHVDHGKTTLTYAMTGKWTDTHSEELKRGISIRVGYADANIYQCEVCNKYTFSSTCTCGGKTKLKRKISFVDAPGHETLMTSVISISSIINGALFLIAANEKCPQPQTKEHFMVLKAMDIRNIVIVQTKVDLVSKERAMENYREIKEFLKGKVEGNIPIIPVAANHKLNIDAIAEAIEKTIPTPKYKEDLPFRAYISRSFDINKPGTPIKKLKGGVIGGSIAQGKVCVGDRVKIVPGIQKKENAAQEPEIIEIKSLAEEKESLKCAKPGGLIAFGTGIDPAFTKSDRLAGSVIGDPKNLPDPTNKIEIEYALLDREDVRNTELKENELLAINIYTTTTVGVVKDIKKNRAIIELRKPVPTEKNAKIAITRRFNQMWKLSAWGKII